MIQNLAMYSKPQKLKINSSLRMKNRYAWVWKEKCPEYVVSILAYAYGVGKVRVVDLEH
nr:hypothetical protein Iba_chr04fCG6740 [Ipomoea batatas]